MYTLSIDNAEIKKHLLAA